jgi:hypothetical protein
MLYIAITSKKYSHINFWVNQIILILKSLHQSGTILIFITFEYGIYLHTFYFYFNTIDAPKSVQL